MLQLRTFDIKIIAITSMIIDHIGLFFFPQDMTFRLIGRIAFPLFAWLVANGAYHTHNMRNYLIRLFAFALLSQAPFILANQLIDPSYQALNVLFTLFLGLVAIAIIKATSNKSVWILGTVLSASVAMVFQTDYGAAGVFSVVAFYLTFKSMRYTILTQAVILFVLPVVSFYLSKAYAMSLSYYYLNSLLEPFALVALLPLMFYRGKLGPKAKYLFYIVYPLQYVVFYLIIKIR